jgi:hypothetical protein
MSIRKKNKKKTGLVRKAATLWLLRFTPLRWVSIALAVLGAVSAVVAAVRKRRAKQADVPYGPPNESVPSHETLAPAKEAAEQSG